MSGEMGTVLFLVACVLAFAAMGGPRRPLPPWRRTGVAWVDAPRRLADDVVRGMTVLARLDAHRRDRLGRPWA